MIYLLNKDLITCIFRTLLKTSNWKKIKDNSYRQNFIMQYFIFYYLQIIESMKNQIKHFSNQNILSQDIYKYQIDLSYDILNNVNMYMQLLIEKNNNYKNKNLLILKNILQNIDLVYLYITSKNHNILDKLNNSIFNVQLKKNKKLNSQNIISFEEKLYQFLNLFYQDLIQFKENSSLLHSMISKKDYYI
jgi:hypothetical protein